MSLMDRRPPIFEAIERRDTNQIIEIVDRAFKQAAREASFRAHAAGIEVTDGRAEEERCPKALASLDQAAR